MGRNLERRDAATIAANPRKVQARCRSRTGKIHERPVVREGEMRRPCRDRSPDAFDHRNRTARRLPPSLVERHREQHSPIGIHEVTSGHVTGIACTVDQHRSFHGPQVLQDHLCPVPQHPVVARASPDREQDGIAARHHLRAMRPFVIGDPCEQFRLAGVWRHPQDAVAALAEDDAVRTPAHAIRIHGRTQRDRGASADRDSLDRRVRRRKEGDGLAIGREDGARHVLCVVGARNGSRLELGD